MMTIDEAIAHAREVARVNRLRTKHPAVHRNDEDEIEACLLCAEEHNQIAEWLEELKAYKSDEFTKNLQELVYKQGYSKAIDDFVDKAFEMIKAEQDARYGYLDGMDIREIAEQLKESERGRRDE